MSQAENIAMVTVDTGVKRNSSTNLSIIQKSQAGSADFVSHLTIGDVKLMAIVAAKTGTQDSKTRQHGERTAALIRVLFDGCLRISEALALRPIDIQDTDNGVLLAVLGKGNRPGLVAISAETANALRSYCYKYHVLEAELIFDLSRSQAFRCIEAIYEKAGVRQPSINADRVGAVHVLRHSGCLARLAISGNPREVQAQLRHKSSAMTLRYMKTLSNIEALRNQQQVNVWGEN